VISALTQKLISKILSGYFSWRFRLRFGIFTGKVRADLHAVENCIVGKNLVLRGAISCHASTIRLGDSCALANTAEIGAENGAAIAIGVHASFGPRTVISASGGIVEVGDRTSFFSDCIISGVVRIGSDCLFAKNVTILSSTHEVYGTGTIRENDAAALLNPEHKRDKPVQIGDDCWLGSNTVILPGVSLGRGTVVGANAVVTKTFPDYSILAGVPARIVGSRLQEPDSP
jgi:acetyltransferase-like isoleucine patch superfamily enzyme